MQSAWRLVSAEHAKEAFTGEGARRYRGRWHSRGTRLVYLAQYRSLAVLEVLANARPRSPREEYSLILGSWDDSIMEVLPQDKLPADWRVVPHGPAAAAIGDSWVEEMRSAVLAIPNVIIPAERNYLINPAHKDFRRIKVGRPESFIFDSRLLQG